MENKMNLSYTNLCKQTINCLNYYLSNSLVDGFENRIEIFTVFSVSYDSELKI